MQHTVVSGLKKSCARLALAIFLFNISSTAFAVTVDVDTDNDGPGCELREAVNAVGSGADFGGCVYDGDTVLVTPGGDNTITLQQGEIGFFPNEFNNAYINITGVAPAPGAEPAVTIDANNLSRVFSLSGIEPGTMEIHHLNLINGNADDGGLIYLSGAGHDLTLNNVNLSNSTATDRGGALYVGPNGSLTMTDTEVFNNSAEYDDFGPVYTPGGGIFIDTNSTGVNITSTGTYTDGIYENTGSFGGGINIESTATPINISNTDFTNNTGEFGGAIHGFGNTLEITNSIFQGNQAITAGAIYSNFDFANISDSNFILNTASNSGGAILLDFPFFSGVLKTLTLVNVNFDQNSAAFDGGAVYCSSAFEACEVSITADQPDIGFTNNTAGEFGGAIYTNPVTADEECGEECGPGEVTYPVDSDLTIENILFDGNIAGDQGAAIMTGAETSITDAIFSNNDALSIIIANDDLSVVNTDFINNEGVTIYNDLSMPPNPSSILIEIIDSLFEGNDGGGVFLTPPDTGEVVEYTVNILRTVFNENFGPSLADFDLTAYDFGGDVGVINITDSSFLGNTPSAGLFFGGNLTINTFGASLNLLRTTIANNTTSGVSVRAASDVTSSIINSTITNNDNSALAFPPQSNQGGGVRNDGGVMNIIHSTIANNFARNRGVTSTGFGGGIYTTGGGIINLTNSIISDNQADQAGEDCYIDTIFPGTNIFSLGNNLISDLGLNCAITLDPDDITGESALLEALADNGGLTLTRLLNALSPALNAADNALDIAQDQRGINRPQLVTSDMGAVEMTEPDVTPPVIAEVTPVPTPTTDTTPNYTFSSDEAGTITYGGDCSSATTAAVIGNNTITFNVLAVGTHSNCTILVTDSSDNDSNLLSVNNFEITEAIGPAPVIAEVTPVPTPTTDDTPTYTFSSTSAGTITYGGACTSATTTAVVGNNTITFNTLPAGTYACSITVTDGDDQDSNLLNISAFTIEAPAIPPVTGGGGGGAGGGFGQPSSQGNPSTPEQPTQPETPTQPENPVVQPDPTRPEQPLQPEPPVTPQPESPAPQQTIQSEQTAPPTVTPEEIIFVTEQTPVDSIQSTGSGIYGHESNKTVRQLSLTCNYADFSSQYGISINQNSDSDGDGLSDQLECLAQTNPTETDSDGDGLSDAYEELSLGTNPNQSNGQPGSNMLIITTPEEQMLTGDESPLVKGINTAKGEVDIYIFDRADFEEISIKLQEELNADENLNDQQRNEIYDQKFTEYVQSILAKFITKSLDPENPEEAKFINKIQLLGETPTGNNSVFLLDSEKSLIDNTYLAMAHNAQELYSEEVEFKVDSTLKILNPNVDTLGNKPIPTEALLGELKIEIDPGNFRPVLAGNIKEPSKVVANWQSDIVSSALIADSLDEDFRLSAPADLPPGEHTVYVTAYRRSDGAQSETLKIPFTVSADSAQSGPTNDWLRYILGLIGILVIGGAAFSLRNKQTKKPPIAPTL
ncbi:MAG: choice-of-anchor Q domain-containing protein [Candidatus Altimarinota bacterium]